MEKVDELEELALEEALGDITIIEWPEIAMALLPPEGLEIHFSFAGQGESRRLEWRGKEAWGPRLKRNGELKKGQG